MLTSEQPGTLTNLHNPPATGDHIELLLFHRERLGRARQENFNPQLTSVLPPQPDLVITLTSPIKNQMLFVSALSPTASFCFQTHIQKNCLALMGKLNVFILAPKTINLYTFMSVIVRKNNINTVELKQLDIY